MSELPIDTQLGFFTRRFTVLFLVAVGMTIVGGSLRLSLGFTTIFPLAAPEKDPQFFEDSLGFAIPDLRFLDFDLLKPRAVVFFSRDTELFFGLL